jgi:hypothetical protein
MTDISGMRVAIATIALERRGSGRLMLTALAELANQGYRVFVGDGGSSDEFVAGVREMGHEVRQPGRGIRGQIETALEAARDAGTHVLYVESDKLEFVRDRLAKTIDEYVERELDYAVVGRAPADLASFPVPQIEIERAENALMGAVLGIDGDFVAGPALMPSGHVARLRESRFYGTDQNGWGTNWFLLGRAWSTGLRVGVINTAPGVHASARDEFNPGYRLYQAYAILGGFYDGAGIPYDWRTSTGARIDAPTP